MAQERADFQRQLYINGEFVPASGEATLAVINPSTEEEIVRVAAAQKEDVDAAVQAAHRAFHGVWRHVDGPGRAALLHRLADLVERDADHLAWLESIDNGKLLGMACHADVNNLIRTLRYFAGYADKLDGRAIAVPEMFGRPVLAYTRLEPLGVIGAIGAWNAPTMYVGWKAAAALAAGNTVVLKPAEEAPAGAGGRNGAGAPPAGRQAELYRQRRRWAAAGDGGGENPQTADPGAGRQSGANRFTGRRSGEHGADAGDGISGEPGANLRRRDAHSGAPLAAG